MKTDVNKSQRKLDIFIGVLSVILVLLIVINASLIVHGGKTYEATDVNMMAWSLGRGCYLEIARDLERDRRANCNPPKAKEYYQIAATGDYFTNAVRYYAYERENSDKAEFYLNKMNDTVNVMGEYIFAREDIDNRIKSFISKQNNAN